MNVFGENLKKLRLRENMTQGELAEKLNISRSAISMYENGIREPDFETIELIASFFNVDMNYIFGIEEQLQEYDPDAIEILEMLDRNPELKMLFMKTGKLSKEDKEQIVRILKATLPPNHDEGC